PSVNDRSTFFHLREERLAEAEHGKDIYTVRFLEFFIRNILDTLISPMEGGIVHQNVDRADPIDGFLGNSFRFGRLADVTGEQDRLTSGFGYQSFRFPRVLLFG